MLEHWVGRNVDQMMPYGIIDGEFIRGYGLLRMRAKTWGEVRYENTW
jgi:xanthine dehydrogenase molybdopterin-binding subunit B